MKVVNLLLAAMFLIFAFVQVNDPDPVLWIVIYGLAAVSCVLAAFRMYFRIPLIVLTVFLAAYAIKLLPGVGEWLSQEKPSMLFDDVAKMQYAFVEEAREFLGLAICMVVLLMHLIRSYRVRVLQ